MRKEILNGSYTANYETDWIEIGNKNSLPTLATINTEWTGAAGTAFDGTVDIYLTNDQSITGKAKDTIDINAVDSTAVDNTIGLVIPFKYIKAKLTMNSLTTVSIYMDVTYNKVKA